MPYIPTSWRLMAAALGLVAIAGIGFKVGYTFADSKALKREAQALQQLQALADEAQENYTNTVRQQMQSYAETIEGLSNENRQINQKYRAARDAVRADGGLRITQAVCPSSVPATSDPASGIDGASPGTIALPEPVERRLFDLVESADSTASRLRWLQSWVADNCAAK